ncbi:MAG: T9SS type A sorting domain-containing protein [Ignavibacteriales bacterium]|nr:T9SS type A sorting domain-containing protein [Ignavibacteriales bacterium]
MVKHFLFSLIAIAFLYFTASADDAQKRHPGQAVSGGQDQEVIAPVDAISSTSKVAGPMQTAAASVRIEKVTSPLGTPIKLGTTDYDGNLNSGSTQCLRVVNGKIHFAFMERFSTLAAPLNNRAQAYVYYDPVTSTKATSQPVAKATAATGFGNVDAFAGGVADGIGILTGHVSATVPVWFALDAGPGTASFSKVDIGTLGQLDPEAVIDNNSQTIWLTSTGRNRLQYAVTKSTDYGASWVSVDTNLVMKVTTAKDMKTGSLDVPLAISPDGKKMAMVTTLVPNNTTMSQHVVPFGTAPADSARRIGYFLSLDQGKTWTWNDIGISGEKIIVAPGDTVYPLYANFGQFGAAFDKANKLHVVCNGYCVKYLKPSNRSYYGTSFSVLYWKEGVAGWKRISNAADATPMVTDTTSIWNYTSYTYRRASNSYGFCWPTISIDTLSTNGGVFASWSQPRYKAATQTTPASIDTNWSGYVQYDVWYSTSGNGGTSWNAAQKLANSDMGMYTYADKYLTKSGNTYSAHLVYYADTAGGATIGTVGSSGGRAAFKSQDWFYQKVDFSLTSVTGDGLSQPGSFTLEQNFPNPFNPATTFRFSLPTASSAKLAVYNMLGQEIATVINSSVTAGIHEYNFDASNLSSGMYIYRLTADKFSSARKMMLMK